MCEIINKILFIYFTVISWLVFSIKCIIDEVIGAMLGFLLSVQAVGDYSAMRRAYIVCVLIAIFTIFADKYLRSQSKTFDLWKTLTGPVNIGVPLVKVIYYRRYNHLSQLTLLLLFELIKIGSSVYCLITLAIEVRTGIFLNYVLFAILLTDSLLGLCLYLPLFINVMFYPNFYHKWLEWFSLWYLQCVINVEVEQRGYMIIVKFTDLIICDKV